MIKIQFFTRAFHEKQRVFPSFILPFVTPKSYAINKSNHVKTRDKMNKIDEKMEKFLKHNLDAEGNIIVEMNKHVILESTIEIVEG